MPTATAAARQPCRIAPSGLPKPQPSARNPCVRIVDVSLRRHRLNLTIRTRPNADGRLWATLKRPGVTDYLRTTGDGATYRASGTVSGGRWTVVVHFKPVDNRLWRPVIVRRRLIVR